MYNPLALTAVGIGKSIYDQYNKKVASTPTPTQQQSPMQPVNTYYGAIEKQKLKAIQSADQAARQQIFANYETGRQTLGGQTATGARNIAEYLSQRGMQNSGVGAQQSINQSAALVSGVASLEQQKNQALLDQQANYDKQVTDAKDYAYQQEVNAINNGAYSNDYQAEINRRTAIDPNDPIIAILEGKRYGKKTDIAAAEAEAKQQAFDNWYKMQSLNRSSGGGGLPDGINSTMTKDEAYGQEYATVSAGSVSPADIKSNSAALIGQYGVTKYNALLKAAEENYSIRNSMMAQGFGTSWKGRWY